MALKNYLVQINKYMNLRKYRQSSFQQNERVLNKYMHVSILTETKGQNITSVNNIILKHRCAPTIFIAKRSSE